MIQAWWTKSTKGEWLSLERVDLSNVFAYGVYAIWHTGNPPRVVKIGQGNIADRLTAHRSDPSILAYKGRGDLYVTWAAVEAHQRDGVERYLADTWSPLVGDRYPAVSPIVVNSPWG